MKLRDSETIDPIKHSTLVSNLVPVKKKNGDIRLCVGFRNLNISSLKDNYPLPNMEAMLHRVISCELLSMMDGFSIYNQMKVKLSSTRLLSLHHGEHVYARIPFGLTSAKATFQRTMDVAFLDFIDIFMVVYQDDLIEYFKKEEDNCMHLEKNLLELYSFVSLSNLRNELFG